MNLALVLLLPLQDLPRAQEAPAALRAARLQPETAGDEVVYHCEGLELRVPGWVVRAASGSFRLDRRLYEEAAARAIAGQEPQAAAPAPPPGEPQQQRPRLLAGEWTGRLLEALGVAPERGLLRSFLLEGAVEVSGPDATLLCERLHYDGATGTSAAEAADLRLGRLRTANDWPLRLRAATLREDADSSLHATQARLTTCDRASPHYELALDTLDAAPIGPPERQQWLWSPERGRLLVSGRELLPVPAPDFRNGESILGLREARAISNDIYGRALSADFEWQLPLAADAPLRWSFQPMASSRRGFPLRAVADLATDGYAGRWDLFYLRDGASDVHRMGRFVARDGDDRHRLRLDNRFALGGAWQLDADLALTSDPLVDPEFFNEPWRREDDAQTELYIRRSGESSFLDARTLYRLDDSGYTPLQGFPPPGGAAPATLDTLPRVRYDRYSGTLAEVPVPFLGGADGAAALNLSFGAEAARLRLRDRELTAAAGQPAYLARPDLERDRARAWAELALPLSAGGPFLRPGLAFAGTAYDAGLAAPQSESRGLAEAFVETGLLLQKDWEHGWRHLVLPQARLRASAATGAGPAEVPRLDATDRARAGDVLELSLRQLYYAPGTSQPWLDLDVLVPWYPDPQQPLRDGIFPAPRRGAPPNPWGPMEVRAVWSPGAYGEPLGPAQGSERARGLQVETRWRQDLAAQELDELFMELSNSPHDRLRYGADLFKVNDRFSVGHLFGEWRFAEEWALQARVPYEFTGAAGTRFELALRHYAHDWMLELGVTRDQATGESGFSFHLAPRFLVDRPAAESRPRMLP